MIEPRRRLKSLVVGLGLSAALAVAVLIPAGYFAMAHGDRAYEVDFSARLKASRLAKYIYSHRTLWQYQTLRLAALIEVPEADETGTRQRIFDAGGKLVMETGQAPVFPVIERSAPIVVAGSQVGSIQTAASYRDVVVGTGIAALFGALLGFGIFFVLRILPLRVIDQTLGALETQTLRFETSLDNMSHGLCMFDADRRLVVSNRRYCEMFGLNPAQIAPGMTESQLMKLAMDEPGRVNSAEAVSRTVEEAGVLHRANGNLIAVLRRPMANGGEVVTYEDITERRLTEAKMVHMARHDPLTNLPNRRLFHEELEHALSHAEAGEKIAVLFLDIDHFKSVNDSLGHPVGDELLRAVTQRLLGAVRAADTIARLGGDEFAIVQAHAAQPSNSTILAARLIEIMAVPFLIAGNEVVIGTSIGIALSPDDGTEPQQLLRNADMALYRAKEDGRGIHRFYESQMDARAKQRRALEIELRHALQMNEFTLFYQPTVDTGSELVTGFEALLRWRHPTRGLIQPDDFIPMAEETGLIVPISEWIFGKACREAVKWPDNITVAVNLSPVQLKSPNLVLAVKAALAASGLAPERLELEITESVLLQDNERTMSVLHQFRALGIRIAMDDFGTGYSSISYLRKFPFDRIKIDRSFVNEMADRKDSMAIIRAVSAIGISLNMATTAEGVETRDQFERVKSEGCTQVQGFLFGKPRPAAEIPALLVENAAGRIGRGKPRQMEAA
ncbi:MAG: EAL domain-containing protein [Mesorhizobium sp.]|nr:EAL domain-containing protein [Mesorhizobium sp.]